RWSSGFTAYRIHNTSTRQRVRQGKCLRPAGKPRPRAVAALEAPAMVRPARRGSPARPAPRRAPPRLLRGRRRLGPCPGLDHEAFLRPRLARDQRRAAPALRRAPARDAPARRHAAGRAGRRSGREDADLGRRQRPRDLRPVAGATRGGLDALEPTASPARRADRGARLHARRGVRRPRPAGRRDRLPEGRRRGLGGSGAARRRLAALPPAGPADRSRGPARRRAGLAGLGRFRARPRLRISGVRRPQPVVPAGRRARQYLMKLVTSTPSSAARPFKASSSMRTAVPTTSAPSLRSSRSVAAIVPPVASRSSTTRTRCPCPTASAWICSALVPYSRAYSSV